MGVQVAGLRTGTLPGVANLVFFHAHPDDEAIATGGTMAAASQAGHQVWLVVATHGELGEPVPGVLAPGEPLWERRVAETHRSADILGAQGVHFLGYRDSGMAGEPSNDDPACFWQASVDEAAAKLADLLAEVGADVLTVYDDHGGYGHPDHIQVHRVGVQAAHLAGVANVFEATMNRDHIARLLARQTALATGADASSGTVTATQGSAEAAHDDGGDEPDLGVAEHRITHAIDVSEHLGVKRAAMEAHASQIGPDSMFMALSPPDFSDAFGTEWFIRSGHHRRAGKPFATDLLDP